MSQIQDSQKELNKTIERFDKVLNGSTISVAEIDQLLAEEGTVLNTTVVRLLLSECYRLLKLF